VSTIKLSGQEHPIALGEIKMGRRAAYRADAHLVTFCDLFVAQLFDAVRKEDFAGLSAKAGKVTCPDISAQ